MYVTEWFLNSKELEARGLVCDEEEKAVSVIPPRSVSVQIPSFATLDYSRLKTEFEMESFIGKGAYGDVLKVRNILDNRQYAIKRIPTSSRNKQLYKKMTREVELLSRLNHENVVRYFNSWVETQSAPIAGLNDKDESEWSIIRGMQKYCHPHQSHFASTCNFPLIFCAQREVQKFVGDCRRLHRRSCHETQCQGLGEDDSLRRSLRKPSRNFNNKAALVLNGIVTLSPISSSPGNSSRIEIFAFDF